MTEINVNGSEERISVSGADDQKIITVKDSTVISDNQKDLEVLATVGTEIVLQSDTEIQTIQTGEAPTVIEVPDSPTVFVSITGAGGSDAVLIGGEGIEVNESPADTWTISVSGDYALNSYVDDVSAALDNYVLKSGDTMTGTLTMSGAAIQLDPTYTPAHSEGMIFYDQDDKCLTYYNEQNDMAVQVGQEQILRVVNKTGVTIPNGKVVRINGAQGNRPTIELADADLSSSHDTIGVTTHEIPDNQNGYVTTFGLVRGLDTSSFTAGASVYLSQVAGDLTDIIPVYPAHEIKIGEVITSDAAQGIILVDIDVHDEIDEIHGVTITSPTNGDLLTYTAATSAWENNFNITDYATLSTVSSISGDLQFQVTTISGDLDALEIDVAEISGNYVPFSDLTVAGIPFTDAISLSGANTGVLINENTLLTEVAGNTVIASLVGNAQFTTVDGNVSLAAGGSGQLNVTGSTGFSMTNTTSGLMSFSNLGSGMLFDAASDNNITLITSGSGEVNLNKYSNASFDGKSVIVSGGDVIPSSVNISELRTDVDTISGNLDTLETDVANISGNLQSQIDSNDSDILGLRTDVDSISANYATVSYVDAADTTLQANIDAIDVISGTNITVNESTPDNWTVNLDASIAGDHTFENNLTVSGNLYVNGTETIVNTASVSAADNQIVINAGETGPGVTAGFAGIRVDRGTEPDYDFQFRESDDSFVIGENGSFQPVATREDTPLNDGIAEWNSSQNRFDTVSKTTLAQDLSGTLDGYYVNIAGDTMTGSLILDSGVDLLATGSNDIGSSSTPFANIYSNDLNVFDTEILADTPASETTIASFRGLAGGNSKWMRIKQFRNDTPITPGSWHSSAVRIETQIDTNTNAQGWIEFRNFGNSTTDNRIALGDGGGAGNEYVEFKGDNVVFRNGYDLLWDTTGGDVGSSSVPASNGYFGSINIEANPASIIIKDTDSPAGSYLEMGIRGGSGEQAFIEVDEANTTSASELIIKVDGGEVVSYNSSSITYNDVDLSNDRGTGVNNEAFGEGALESNPTGNNNTAFGYRALRFNTTGFNNTGVGQAVLFNNTVGNNNVGFGSGSLTDNTSGNENTALGISTLTSNLVGSRNTAVGYQSMFNFVQSGNTQNTAVGWRAGFNMTSGTNNAILGRSAGDSQTGYNSCTLVGHGADASVNNLTNSTALGNNALIDANNQITLGDDAITEINFGGLSTPLATLFAGSLALANGMDIILTGSNVTVDVDATSYGDSELSHGLTNYSISSNNASLCGLIFRNSSGTNLARLNASSNQLIIEQGDGTDIANFSSTGVNLLNGGDITWSTGGGDVGSSSVPASNVYTDNINFGNQSLSHYQEGTWTVTLTDGTNNATLTTADARYTRIGRSVTASFRIIASSLGSASGNVKIGGLPFTSVNSNAGGALSVSVAAGLNLAAAGYSLGGYVEPNSTRIQLRTWDLTGGNTNTQFTELTATAQIWGTVTYEVS